MGRVFVVQRPGTRDREGGWREKYDLAPAAHFGELVELLGRGNLPGEMGEAWARLGALLRDFSDADYLLLLGDPVAIAAAAMAASAANGGRVAVLKWDRWRQEYRPHRLGLPGTMARGPG